MKLFLSCAGNFPVSKFIYKLAKIEKTNKQTKTKNKSRDLHKDCLCVILMMAYAIHSNVRNLGLFFIYDKVGISR
jgi:hypothetical protein